DLPQKDGFAYPAGAAQHNGRSYTFVDQLAEAVEQPATKSRQHWSRLAGPPRIQCSQVLRQLKGELPEEWVALQGILSRHRLFLLARSRTELIPFYEPFVMPPTAS